MGHLTTPEADLNLDVKVPVLDHGFVSLIDYMGGDQRIAEAAWVSSIDEVDAEKKTPEAIRNIINYMMRERHTSPFEQVELVFRCKMPIFVARQWIRHRTASVNEMSGRYRLLPPESYSPELSRMGGKGKDNKQGTEGGLSNDTKEQIKVRMDTAQADAWIDYAWLANTGLANELARLNLPLSAYTEWYWKIDLHNFFHFIGLRMHPHSQWEIQQYATKMYNLVKAVVPMACAAYEEYRHNAVTLTQAEMKVIKLIVVNGLGIIEAERIAGLKGKALGRFLDKLGV